MNIKGTEMSIGLQVTLAHELTHALQDQYFDLSKIQDGLAPDEAGAVRSVIEGDAVATENAYVKQLSEADRQAYLAQNDKDVDEANGNLSSVPQILTTQFGGLYQLGQGFVEFLESEPGSEDPKPTNVDEALREPPTSSGQLFDPATFLDHTSVTDVETPKQDGVAKVYEKSSFGASLLFLMMSERIAPSTAMVAIDGWRGDAYQAAKLTTPRGKRMCIAADIATASAHDATELHDALTAWRDRLPAEADATVASPTAGPAYSVSFATCDPGAKADVKLTGQSKDAMNYPLSRLEVAASMVKAGADRTKALCIGTELVVRLEPSDLTDNGPEAGARIQGAAAAARAKC